MAKKKSSEKKSTERKPRTRKVYGFDVEKARTLRDEKYKEKENNVACMLRGLIAANRDGYTADEIFELANKTGAKIEDPNILPIGTLVKKGVLKLTTKTKQEASTRSAAPAKAAKKVRKARKSKHNGSAHESTSSEAARESQAEAAPF